MSLHRRRVHPDFVPGCDGCKFGTIQMATEPTNDEQAHRYRFQEGFAAEFTNGDRENYLALRRQGLQPSRIAGSAELATRASTAYEIESGHIAEDPKALRDALQVAKDGGFDPMKPATTPKVAT